MNVSKLIGHRYEPQTVIRDPAGDVFADVVSRSFEISNSEPSAADSVNASRFEMHRQNLASPLDRKVQLSATVLRFNRARRYEVDKVIAFFDGARNRVR